MGGCATWHYFDDQGTLDLRSAKGSMPGMSAQEFVQRLFTLVSRPFAPEKSIPACYSVLHLGLINDLTRWGQKHTLRLTPRPGKIEELLAQLTLLCQLTETGVDEVASLAGGLMFLTTGCYEKSSRGGYQALYHWIREACGGRPHVAKSGIISDVTDGLRISMEFFSHILKNTDPVVLSPMQRAKACKILYSDAEWSERPHPLTTQADGYCDSHSTGMGAIVFAKPQTAACCGEAPDQIVKSLMPRQTQIIALELLAVAGALSTFRDIIAGHDIIVFCDNQSVCAALTKGASKALDIQFFATAFHILCQEFHCCPWIEWIPTDANPADSLSRIGLSVFVPSVGKMLLPAWSTFDPHDAHLAIRTKAYTICSDHLALFERKCCPESLYVFSKKSMLRFYKFDV